MNRASATISMFGGAAWTPRPWRSRESTVTMKGKQVTIMAIPGARLSTVISANSWIAVADNPASPVPRSIVCALALFTAVARNNAAIPASLAAVQVREGAAVTPPPWQPFSGSCTVKYLDQAQGETVASVLHFFQGSAGDDLVANAQLHQVIGHLFQRYQRPFSHFGESGHGRAGPRHANAGFQFQVEHGASLGSGSHAGGRASPFLSTRVVHAAAFPFDGRETPTG